jgi:cyclohexanone monooxygenase
MNQKHSSNDSDVEVDVETVRARYEAERNKRLNKVGTDQYIFLEGDYRKFAQDPHAGPILPRAPIEEDLDILIIGAGLCGIQLGAELRRNSLENFRILDVASDFGGTWYWNRYPGLRCDVESYIYLPMLEETRYVPSERYVRGSEILAYCQLLGRHFDLYPRALFQTGLTGVTWDEKTARWIATTTRGDRFHCRFVATQSGIFNVPQLPGIPGIKDFQGHTFHSARWATTIRAVARMEVSTDSQTSVLEWWVRVRLPCKSFLNWLNQPAS